MEEQSTTGQTAEMNPTEHTIHEMRKEIDGLACRLIQFASGHEYRGMEGVAKAPPEPKIVCEAANEFDYAIKSLREAKMWLGETLKVHGNPLPPQFADNAERGSGNEEAE